MLEWKKRLIEVLDLGALDTLIKKRGLSEVPNPLAKKGTCYITSVKKKMND